MLLDGSALASLASADEVWISDNPLISDETIAAVLAGLQVSGTMQVTGNGTGQDPVCGFIPQ